MRIERIRKRITLHKRKLLLVALISDLLAYYGSRMIANGRQTVSLAVPLDAEIPFVPWMIAVYVGCYLFWGVNYVLATAFDDDAADTFIMAHVLGEFVCFLFFICLPTTMRRPEIVPQNLVEELVRIVYSSDAPNNLFPSIHCFVSWLCWIGVRKNPQIPRWYRWFSLGYAVMVCISTLTVKQHVIVDVPAGILLAETCYLAAASYRSMRLKKNRIRGMQMEGKW